MRTLSRLTSCDVCSVLNLPRKELPSKLILACHIKMQCMLHVNNTFGQYSVFELLAFARYNKSHDGEQYTEIHSKFKNRASFQTI